MSYPVQSANLNPIEAVWDDLDRKVRAKQPTSAPHLWKILQESSAEVSSFYVQSLVERKRRLYEAVVAAKWSHSDELTI